MIGGALKKLTSSNNAPALLLDVQRAEYTDCFIFIYSDEKDSQHSFDKQRLWVSVDVYPDAHY